MRGNSLRYEYGSTRGRGGFLVTKKCGSVTVSGFTIVMEGDLCNQNTRNNIIKARVGGGGVFLVEFFKAML